MKYYDIKIGERIDALDNLLRLSPVLPVMVSFNLLSLTVSKYKSICPQFIFELYGESGTFKSTISNLVFGIFEEDYEHAPINLKAASLSSLHSTQMQYRDCVTVFDDAAPSPDGNDDMCRKVESIARSYGDSTGRTVMNGITSTHNTKPAGLGSVTGEFQPLRDTSDMARAVMYELKKGEIDEKELATVESQKSAYIRFITDYIGWICIRKDKYLDELERKFAKRRNEYAELKKIHSRLPENIGWICAGFSMFLKFASEKYSVSDTKIKKWSKIFQKGLDKCIEVQKREMKTVDEAQLFVYTVKMMIASKQIDLSNIYRDDAKKKRATIKPNTVGYVDDNFVYLDMDIAYSHTDTYLRKIGEGYSLPKKALQSRLVTHEFVILSEKERQTTKVTINGMRIPLLKFKKKHFFEV